MKVNAKKVFAAVLALGLVISAAGCGNKNTAGLDAEGNYEVVWYNTEQPMKDHNLVYEEISKYTKEKIGVTVKYTDTKAKSALRAALVSLSLSS